MLSNSGLVEMVRFCPNCHKLLPIDNAIQTGGLCAECAQLIPERTDRSKAAEKNKTTTADPGATRLFPFDSIRIGQSELMQTIWNAMAEHRNLVVHAPTGLGKTVSVLAPGLQFALANDKKLFFLTSRNTQHRIAIDTLRAIKAKHGCEFAVVDIVSKHKMCPREREFGSIGYSLFNELCRMEMAHHKCKYFSKKGGSTVDELRTKILHAEEFINHCRDRGLCPYRIAMELAKTANIIICDYNYIFSDINEAVLPKLEVGFKDLIVVVDEAHNLPERIRAQLCYELAPVRLANIIKGLKARDKFLARIVSELVKMLDEALANLPERRCTLLTKTGLLNKLDAILHRSLDKPMELAAFRTLLLEKSIELSVNSTLKSHLLHLEQFLQYWAQYDKSSIRYADRTGEHDKLVVRVLDPAVFSAPVFDSLHCGILMSGTLYPPEMYAMLLGLPPDRTSSERYSSPFPAENRPVAIDNSVTTAFSQRNMDMYFNIATRIHQILGLVPGNVAVFFTSYDFLNSILAILEQQKLVKSVLVETRDSDAAEKATILDALRSHRDDGKGAVMLAVMGGSMAEGVDYPHGLLSAIIVVGIPLPPPSFELEALNRYYSDKFGSDVSDDYCSILPAMNKVMQAAGRSIRSATDRSMIVLLDRRFELKKYGKYFPYDYNAVPLKDLERMCQEFYLKSI